MFEVANDQAETVTNPRLEGVVMEFNRPKLATKRLKLKTTNGRPKVVVSSNLLRLFGFDENARVIETPLEGGGIRVELARDLLALPDGLSTKKVYVRRYRQRKASPLEHLIEVNRKDLLSPFEGVQYAHVTMEPGLITIRPLADPAQRRIDAFKRANRPYTALCGCTSGVDAKALSNHGFKIDSVIEYRPNEPRDGERDFSETGIVNILRNIAVDNVFNEDIMALDIGAVAEAVIRSPSTLWHFSPVCSEFSNGKRRSLKDAAFEEGTSTLDMTLDILELIRQGQPACVLVENVPAYMESDIRKALSLKMRRWGYRAHEAVMDARDHGGLTKRRRYYGFFTSLPADFRFELPAPRAGMPWQGILDRLEGCRDVTDSSSIQKGVEAGLLRILRPDNDYCPTIMRCQSRMTKDTLVIEHEGRFFHPSIEMLAYLQGISDDLALDAVTAEHAVEIIGQSIDGPLHDSIIRSIQSHISASAEMVMATAAAA